MSGGETYLEARIRLEPFSEAEAEMLLAELSGCGYDSFWLDDPLLKAYIPASRYHAAHLKMLCHAHEAVAEWEVEALPEKNWNETWENTVWEPVVVGGQVTVKSKRHGSVPRSRFNICLTPGMAFGTATHPTTCLMMEGMLALGASWMKGRRVADVGCGTGILSILAAKMGARKVFAVDIDLAAEHSAWGNCHSNRVGKQVETACGDASLLQRETYDLILANIHRNVILEDLPTYVRSLRPRGGHLLLSGFQGEEAAQVTATATALGLKAATPPVLRDGWVCMDWAKDNA